jgi:hypothetical protein
MQAKPGARLLGDVAVAGMGGVEGAAEQADAGGSAISEAG